MTVLEYGPGESTKMFQAHDSIIEIETIEHSPAWASRSNVNLGDKVNLVLEVKHHKYPYAGKIGKWDLIFIDGIERPSCIAVAKFRLIPGGIVVVHDAERLEYRAAYENWGLKYFTDEGHTVFMTNDIKTGDMLSRVLL